MMMDLKSGQPAMLTVDELCGLLRVSRVTAYKLIRTGEIPSVRIGKSVRVPASWVHEQTRSAASEVAR